MAVLGRKIFGMTDISIMKAAAAHHGVDDQKFYENLDNLFAKIDLYFEKHMDSGGNNDYSRLPGISEFLTYLRENRIRLGLVTGNIRRHSEWKMENAGFDNYFTTGGFGEDAEIRSEILQIAIDRNPDIMKDLICHFGDSPPDLMAAKDCGIRAVGITEKGGGTHSRADLEKIGHGLIIDSWSEKDLIMQYLS